MRERMDKLTQLLHDHRALWQCQPFVEPDSPWQHSHPELAVWLDTLPDAALAGAPACWLTGAPDWLQALAKDCAAQGTLPALPLADVPAMGADAARRLTARKVKQVDAFCAALLPKLSAGCRTLVDWCAGKGHLGRTLARHTGARLLALEWDPALVAAGQRACDDSGTDGQFACVDVRQPQTWLRLQPEHWVVALHACGDLHAALLAATTGQRVQGVALSPCCYNRSVPAHQHALSQAGRTARLGLAAADLDLLHRDPAVASPRDRGRALQEQAWRLGFDQLQRAVTGCDHYRTMPPFPRSWLRLDFATFCREFSRLDGMELPQDLPFAEFAAQGSRRLALVQRRELLRGLFRAPLEAWLVLDRAQVLAEAGMQVDVGAFCPPAVTPRNALIVGWR